MSEEIKVDQVKQLISLGKEKGYLTYEEVNDSLPDDVVSSREIDDIFIKFNEMDISVIEEQETLYKSNDTILIPAQIYIPNVEAELIEYVRKYPDAVYTISPRTFEELVAAIFKNHGFKVELTPLTRDNGYDILAVERNDLTGENVHLVQCKRYRKNKHVGVAVVRELLGVVGPMRATKGIVVTTSYFTRPAHKVATENSARLSLRDYDIFVKWLDGLRLDGGLGAMAEWVFDKHGKASIIFDDSCFRDNKGVVIAWQVNGNIYSLNGKHIGWYENGVLYDCNNKALGFIANATGYLPYRPGLGDMPWIPNFSGLPNMPSLSGVPCRAGYGGWSEYKLYDYFKKYEIGDGF